MNWFSIKGALATKDYLYITANTFDEFSEKCWYTGLYRASLDLKKLKFKQIFKSADCANELDLTREFNAHQSGGGLTQTNDGRIAFTQGEYRHRAKAQEIQSSFGKIFIFDPTTKRTEVIAMGLRNPAGIWYDIYSSGFWITDHGPLGGDELNFLPEKSDDIVNFGWPISSYGAHYDGKFRADAPLNKSHYSFGFEEPKWHWPHSTPVVTISAAPQKWAEYMLVGVLGHDYRSGQLIYSFKLSHNQSLMIHDKIYMSDRVRSILVIDENSVLISLDSGKFAMISL